MVRGLAAFAAVALAMGVLWLAGEQHKSNSIDAKRVDCSILPWDSGKSPTAKDWRESSIWDEGR